ncbi:MAG TPA: family 16 glycosylhydrolase [Candidatus Saccharimonadales bacterium]|nr:family 16 glycosylhydrolase [Candidatus Saccharimonadales bacterium]
MSLKNNHIKKFRVFKNIRNPRAILVIAFIIIFAGVGYHLLSGTHASSPWVASEAESGVVTQPAEVQNDSTASGGQDVVFGGNTPPGYSSMGLPSYSGSTWAASSETFEDHFQNLSNWNYGLTDLGFTQPGSYTPEGATGTAPYWGSDECPCTSSGDYDLPGNVSQTSTGVNQSLLSTYKPQTFDSNGWGVTFTAHHTGATNYNTTNEGTQTYDWTSGMINTFNKVDFPDPSKGYTEAYVQIKMQQMGYQGTNNGVWNALWFLGATNPSTNEIDLQETGLASSAPKTLFSHNWPSGNDVQIANYNTSSDLSAGYHVYGIDMNEKTNTVSVYLDNQLAGSVPLNNPAPWFLIMNGSICHSYCSIPSNNGDMNMNVMQVQVYQR